jgi:hypothetical protein
MTAGREGLPACNNKIIAEKKLQNISEIYVTFMLSKLIQHIATISHFNTIDDKKNMQDIS